MTSQLTVYITLACTSGVFNLYLCFYVFFKRHQYTDIAKFFVVYTAFIAFYCFGSAAGLMATSLEQVKFWTAVQYLALPFASPLGLLFIMKYLGMNITRNKCIALLLIPLISTVTVPTNDFHHLYYQVFELDPILGAPYIYLEIGIWYMIQGILTFACMFVAFLMLIFRWKETAGEYRPQLIALMFGQLVPMVTAFLYLTGFTPPGVDPVPMVLWLTSLLYVWSISSSRMFAIMPIAKDTIFNSINDGVIVLDESNRLIEFNGAFKKMFPSLNKSMFGMNFGEIWLGISGNPFPSGIKQSLARNIRMEEEITYLERIYQVRTSPLEHVKNSKGLLMIFTDVTEVKRLHEQLEQQAYYDELTQIYNRRAFFEKCERAFSTAKQVSLPFTAILFDIDNFKRVNDTYGHNTGDQLLRHVAKMCRSQLAEGTLFARYGGEEFVIALPSRPLAEGEALAEHLRKHIEGQPLITPEGVISVTFSSGVAEASTGKVETLNQLLIHADMALYDAKRSGRNRVNVYTEKKAE